MYLSQDLWKDNLDIQSVFLALSPSLEESSSFIRFVGGCVRNWLLDTQAIDIDCATSLSPENVIRCLTQKKIPFITPGLSHGTVTALFNKGSIEITTLRRDLKTTGRHAQVAYTSSWEEDAYRRDFTMNALFCDWRGYIYDYVGGVEDLQKGIIRFVGNPKQRLEEDYLRLLRFFRFFAFYGKHAVDLSLLNILQTFVPKIILLSKERLHQEFFKLLQAPYPLKSLQYMETMGIFSFLCPKMSLSSFFKRFLEREIFFQEKLLLLPKKQAFLRFLVLLLSQGGTMITKDIERLALSKKQQKELFFLLGKKDLLVEGSFPAFSKKALYTFGVSLYKDYLFIKAHLCEVPPLKEDLEGLLQRCDEVYPTLIFPLTGKDILSLGISPSPHLGILLGKVRSYWLDKDCTNSKEECLAFLKTIL